MADVNLNLSDSLNVLSGHWIKIVDTDGTSHSVSAESGLKLLGESPIPRTGSTIDLQLADTTFDVIPVFNTETTAIQAGIFTSDTLNVLLSENVYMYVVVQLVDSLKILLVDQFAQGNKPFVINNLEGWVFKKENSDWVFQEKSRDWSFISKEFDWMFPADAKEWVSSKELETWLYTADDEYWKFRGAPNVWVLKKKENKWTK